MKIPSNVENYDAPINTDKEAVGVYLPLDVVDALEDILFYARKGLPRNKRSKLTKSMFYELIFRKVISDYESKGKESVLWDIIIMWAQDVKN